MVIGQFSQANPLFIGPHFGREAARWRLLSHREGRRRAVGGRPRWFICKLRSRAGREKKQGWSLQRVCGPGRHVETLFNWQPVAGGTCCRPTDRLREGSATKLGRALPLSGTGLTQGSRSIASFPRIKAGQVGGRARLGWAGEQGRWKVAVKKGRWWPGQWAWVPASGGGYTSWQPRQGNLAIFYWEGGTGDLTGGHCRRPENYTDLG